MYKSQISSLSNSLGITLENDITVITLADNISHTNCSKIKWEKDNIHPLGVGQLIMPYSEDVSEYWIKYSGAIAIHANLNPKKNHVIASQITTSTGMSLNLRKALETNTETEYVGRAPRIRFINDEYNYAFICKTSRFKQVGETFIVYLEDLGWKFMQKVPAEFRSAYIANQRLDDAFQAICEFMGVEFAYSIQDLSEYTFSADGYSIQKDGAIVENIPSILAEWANGNDDTEEQEEEETDEEAEGTAILGNSELPEASGLIELLNENEESEQQETTDSSDNSINSALNNSEDEENTEDTDEEDEESDTENDQASINEKILQYQEEFDEKIKDLFIGNTYYDSNISDPILNYDWITIEPKAASSTSTGTSTSSGTTSSSGSDSNSESDSDSSSSSQEDQVAALRARMNPANTSIGLKANIVSSTSSRAKQLFPWL